MKDVRGKTVLITGAALGMGKLWAEHFANDGARLCLWDINEEALKKTAAEYFYTFADTPAIRGKNYV